MWLPADTAMFLDSDDLEDLLRSAADEEDDLGGARLDIVSSAVMAGEVVVLVSVGD